MGTERPTSFWLVLSFAAALVALAIWNLSAHGVSIVNAVILISPLILLLGMIYALATGRRW